MHLFRARTLAVLIGAATCGAILPVEREASASVSIAATFDRLLREATVSAVVTPTEQRSLWENGRIYTYTRVHVDRAVAGDLATASDAWVRTMGGIVGKIGHSVDGEAVLTVGRPCLLFMHPGPIGAFEVTARAQGQYPLVTDDTRAVRVIKSSGVGALLPPVPPSRTRVPTPAPLAAQALAADVIHGRLVDDVARDIAAAWNKVHAR
jgi:hypothetical protein